MNKGKAQVPNAVDILKRAFANGKLILVVGCGISSDSVHGVNDFIENFLDFLNKKSGYVYDKILGQGQDSNRAKIMDKQFEYFLQHVNEIIGEERLFKILQISYPHKRTPGLDRYLSGAHISIANSMRTKKIKVLTTNFDGFIEEAFDPNGVDACKVAVKDKDYNNYTNTVESFDYFKLHGSTEIEFKDIAVATLFVEGAGFSKNKKAFLKELLRGNDNGKVVWFYGYGLNDYDMMLLFKELVDEIGFNFTNLVFNLHKGHKDNNIALFEKLLFHKSENYPLQFTTDDLHYLLNEVLEQPHIKKPCMKYPIDDKFVDELNISEVEATLLLSKLLGMVGRGDSEKKSDVTMPLERILLHNSNTQQLETEIRHMMGQLLHDREQKAKMFDKAHDLAKSAIDSRSSLINRNSMRLDTIKIESKRLRLALGIDDVEILQKQFDKLVQYAKCIKKKYENKKIPYDYSEHFKILYFRCCNERARFMFRSGRIQYARCKELGNFKKLLEENPNVGDLDVNATAHYIKFLLNPRKYLDEAKKAAFLYKLLKIDIGDLAASFLP